MLPATQEIQTEQLSLISSGYREDVCAVRVLHWVSGALGVLP